MSFSLNKVILNRTIKKSVRIPYHNHALPIGSISETNKIKNIYTKEFKTYTINVLYKFLFFMIRFILKILKAFSGSFIFSVIKLDIVLPSTQ